jgi:hypothetical protein
MLAIIEKIKASGATSLHAIAKALNARGVATARGGVWTPMQVNGVLRRASILNLSPAATIHRMRAKLAREVLNTARAHETEANPDQKHLT